ncbi:MAG: 1-deoxy-D-xylulose-5-phosphate reductoisomerase [Clostridia bacterium]|nr:1-deoxy-D-xylulose-5-phosphate reductoisomerase [Clostridia bacterium]
MKKRLAVLGCTGSIGTSTLKVADRGDFSVDLLANYSDLDGLKRLIQKYNPRIAVCVGRGYLYQAGKEYASVPEDFLTAPEVYSGSDIVVNGIVGLAGLRPTLAAVRAGKIVATANKESLVCAGTLITKELSIHPQSKLYPLDSEHSAVWQILRPERAEKIILTASGGAFRDLSRQELTFAKASDALKHPTWIMGKKVTVDCATLVNKGMELIEAKHLFCLPTEAIGHRESVIHAIVKNADGTYAAALSAPDMVSPISYALHYPAVGPEVVPCLDFAKLGSFSFFSLDEERFPAFRLAKDVLSSGDIAGCVFNAADEVLVSRFLADEIGFYDLSDGIQRALDVFADEGDFSCEEEVFRMEKAVREYTLNMRFRGSV